MAAFSAKKETKRPHRVQGKNNSQSIIYILSTVFFKIEFEYTVTNKNLREFTYHTFTQGNLEGYVLGRRKMILMEG